MEDQRRHQRLRIPLRVEVQHGNSSTLELEATDMSNGGLFLLMEESAQPPMGELLKVRSVGLGIDGKESGPLLLMRIVRRTATGIGLRLEPLLAQEQTEQSEPRESTRSVVQAC